MAIHPSDGRIANPSSQMLLITGASDASAGKRVGVGPHAN